MGIVTSASERDGSKVVLRIALPLLLVCGALLQSPARAQDNPPDAASDTPPPEDPSAPGEPGQSGPQGPAGPSGPQAAGGGGALTCLLSNPYYKCCGAREYAVYNDTCCDGVLAVGRPFAACCGRVTFDADQQGCCNGRVVNRPTAANGSPRGPLACCGMVGYDPTVSSCCGSTVFRRSPVTACCGGQTYFSPEPLGPGPPEAALPAAGGGSPANGAPGPPSSTPRAMVCCGCRLYSLAGYRGQASCCGDAPYDTATQLCCNGALHSIVGKQSPSCCGALLVDATSSTSCCQGRPYHYGRYGPLCCPNGTLDSCCFYPQYNRTACT